MLIRANLIRLCCRLGVRGYAKAADDKPAMNQPQNRTTYIPKYHEPDYLKYLKPQIPFYDLINFQAKGYDFAVLEEYIRYVQKKAKLLKMVQSKYWATPLQATQYDRLVDGTEVIDATYKINIYERNVQFKEVTTKQLPLFLEIVTQTKPVGVTVAVQEHRPEFDEVRYIPDMLLQGYEEELKIWQQPFSVVEKLIMQKAKKKTIGPPKPVAPTA